MLCKSAKAVVAKRKKMELAQKLRSNYCRCQGVSEITNHDSFCNEERILKCMFLHILRLIHYFYLPVSAVGVAADINNKTGAARQNNSY